MYDDMYEDEYLDEEVSKKKIMVVDDTPLVLRNMKNILDTKYTVFVATSGQQALKMIPEKEPDLLLLDYEMPGMDGKQVYETMLANESMKDIPVVFLTGTSDSKAVYSILKSNPAGYILKPADKEKVLETIEKVFQG